MSVLATLRDENARLQAERDALQADNARLLGEREGWIDALEENSRLQAQLATLTTQLAQMREALADAVEVARFFHMLWHDAKWAGRLERWSAALAATPAPPEAIDADP